MDNMLMEFEMGGASRHDQLEQAKYKPEIIGIVDTKFVFTCWEEKCVDLITTTWDIHEQARGLKRKRGRKDKIHNWTRYLSRCVKTVELTKKPEVVLTGEDVNCGMVDTDIIIQPRL